FTSAPMDNHKRRRARGGGRDRRHDRAQVRRILQKLAAKLQNHRRHSSPVPSSRPSMTLTFWTAWPAAPFTRLSTTETSTPRPDGSTRHPMSQKFVCATCLISGSELPVSRTNL